MYLFIVCSVMTLSNITLSLPPKCLSLSLSLHETKISQKEQFKRKHKLMVRKGQDRQVVQDSYQNHPMKENLLSYKSLCTIDNPTLEKSSKSCKNLDASHEPQKTILINENSTPSQKESTSIKCSISRSMNLKGIKKIREREMTTKVLGICTIAS